MATRALTSEEAAELERLEAEYMRATELAAQAMQKAGNSLSEEALAAVLEGEKRADCAVLRMREIKGVHGQGMHGKPLQPYARSRLQ
jgi:hypothetical protein